MHRRQFLNLTLKSGIVGTAAAWSLTPQPTAIAGPNQPAFPLPQILTNKQDVSDERPCFSPDGRTVLFMRSKVVNGIVAAESDFYTIPITGSPGQETPFSHDPLPAGAGDGGLTRPDCSWTRTSWQIAFSTNTSILLLDVRTRKIQLLSALTGNPADHKIFEYPSWYNNGCSLTATNYWGKPQDPASKQYLLQYDLASGKITKLTSGEFPAPPDSPNNIWSGMSSVSHVGSPLFGGQPLIAIAGELPNANGYNQDFNQIWILEPKSRYSSKPGNVHVVNPRQPLDRQQGRAPWWSPCGRFLAFESNRNTQSNYQIFIQSPFRPEFIVPITPADWAVQHAKWSPCGTKVVFGYNIVGHKPASGIAYVQLPKSSGSSWILNWSLGGFP